MQLKYICLGSSNSEIFSPCGFEPQNMAEKSFIDTDDEMSNKACGPAALNS